VIYTCLFATHGTSLREPLRKGASDEQILDVIRNTWLGRTDRYSEQRAILRKEHADERKVEMFYIGG
jgi:cyclic pyranopterin phosphate synthase